MFSRALDNSKRCTPYQKKVYSKIKKGVHLPAVWCTPFIHYPMLVKENMSAREGKHERSCGNFFYGASSASSDFMCRLMMLKPTADKADVGRCRLHESSKAKLVKQDGADGKWNDIAQAEAEQREIRSTDGATVCQLVIAQFAVEPPASEHADEHSADWQ